MKHGGSLLAIGLLGLVAYGCAESPEPTFEVVTDPAEAIDKGTSAKLPKTKAPPALQLPGDGDEAPAGKDTDAGKPPPSPVTVCDDAATTATCLAPDEDLGYISGDASADVRTIEGTTSSWMTVVIGEDAWGGDPLTLKATLTSPPGTNYDLFVHFTSCASPDKKSEKLTGADTASISIPDATWGNDDKRVMIEVRYVSGACDDTSTWTLKLEGNK